jgi:hypothetical protein
MSEGLVGYSNRKGVGVNIEIKRFKSYVSLGIEYSPPV